MGDRYSNNGFVRARGLQTRGGKPLRVSLCRGVPLMPSNHAITLHFSTQFNLRKETLFRGLNIGICSRTFVALNLESVSFLVIKTGHTTMSTTQQQGSHSAAVPCLRQDSGTHVRLSQIRKCPQQPNIILRIF